MKAMRLEAKDLPRLEKALRLPAGRLGTPRDLGAAVLYFASPGGPVGDRTVHPRLGRWVMPESMKVALRARAKEAPGEPDFGSEAEKVADPAPGQVLAAPRDDVARCGAARTGR